MERRIVWLGAEPLFDPLDGTDVARDMDTAAQLERVAAAIERVVERLEPLPERPELVLRGQTERAVSAEPGDYYDQETSPFSRRKFLRLAREGAFPSSKVGRCVLAKRVDVDTYIARHAVVGAGRTDPEQARDDVDDVLARVGLRRKP